MKTIALIALWPLFLGFMMNEPTPLIMGDWLLQESYTSGCFTTTSIIYRPDEQKIMHFSPPDRYTITSRDTLVASGTFKLTRRENSGTPTNELKLTLNAQQSTGLTLALTTDQPIQSNSAAYPYKRTVYELTDSRLVIGNTLGTFVSRTVYTRAQ